MIEHRSMDLPFFFSQTATSVAAFAADSVASAAHVDRLAALAARAAAHAAAATHTDRVAAPAAAASARAADSDLSVPSNHRSAQRTNPLSS